MLVFPEVSMLMAEFESVKGRWADYCLGQEARNKISRSGPVSDFRLVRQWLFQTHEMKSLLQSGMRVPVDAYPDLDPVLKTLRPVGSLLSSVQVMQLKQVAMMAGELISFCHKLKNRPSELASLAEGTDYHPGPVSEIEKVFDHSGNMLNDASENLFRIRQQLQRQRQEADRIYQRIINRYRKDDWLAETEESWRHGRRVIAVHAVHKRAVKGTIHDISATGKTIFLEPEEAIEINNLILELEYEEQAEIQIILRNLTAELRKYLPVLTGYYRLVAEFDFIRSRALLAISMKASLPGLTDQPVIHICKGYHPLLLLQNQQAGKTTVPFDLKLGEARMLVISGPNAGGKSVCLKAVGLLQLMMQSGLLIPVLPDSNMGLFHSILCDMGDSQSLEFELSTYSARLRNMKVILEKADDRSLFLIDELGTGTDPQLGGALAESILIELNKRKSIGIVTTHFMNLKTLAAQTPGMINGSMAFDSKNLAPLYRLEMGKPGSSYTFVVAQRSGLPQPVIQRAQSKVEKNTLMLEKLLNQAEREKANLDKRRNELEQKEKLSDEILKKAEKLSAEMEQLIRRTEEQAAKKEMMLIRRSEEILKRFFREFKNARNKKAVLDEYLERFQAEREKRKPAPDEQALAEALKQRLTLIKPGVTVTLNQGKTKGTVIEIKNGKALVQFGMMKVQCELTSLYPAETTDNDNNKPQKKQP